MLFVAGVCVCVCVCARVCVCVCVCMCVCVYPQFHSFIYGCAGSSLLLKFSLVVAIGGCSLVPGGRLLFVVVSLVVPSP